jgi:pyruvate/2-oxoglutarate/acetoin dehydrogenase E1 component
MTVSASAPKAELRYAWAINHALAEEMRRDENVVLIGQDIGQFGGSFGVTRDLITEFGPRRVVDTPVSETAIVGAAVGAALAGLRPVAELMFSDFMLIAGDELFHKAAKWRYIHGPRFTVPIVVRCPTGIIGGAGAEHSGSLEALCFHFPGIRAVAPATPRDAKGMLKAAIRDDNPVLFFEHKSLYRAKGEVSTDPEGGVESLEGACVRRVGKDVSIAAYGMMVQFSLEAAAILAKDGVEAEVIDLRSIVPLDHDTVLKSVEKTSRLVTVEEGVRTGGVGAELAARVQEEGLTRLDSPILRVAALDCPMPTNPTLERAVIPSVQRIVQAARRAVGL